MKLVPILILILAQLATLVTPETLDQEDGVVQLLKSLEVDNESLDQGLPLEETTIEDIEARELHGGRGVGRRGRRRRRPGSLAA